jgi:hypothetical protein
MRRNESSMDAQYFENSWRVVCLGGFLFGREAVARSSGSIFAKISGRRDQPVARQARRLRRVTQLRVKQGPASLAPKRSLAAIFVATTLLGICSMQLEKFI